MDFPKQTTDLAGRLAYEIRSKTADNPLELAQGAYKYLKGRFGYGFREGLEQGRFIRWPHEIEKQWECIEAATYTFALAEALNLEPRVVSTGTWKGVNTGHETVDVKVNGHRVLIDPLNDMFGNVSYTDKGIVVEDNPLTERCILPATSIEEVSRYRAIARIDYYRSDEGIINLLRAGQSLPIDSFHTVFVHYDPKTQTLEFQLRTHPPFLEPNYFSQQWHVSQNGIISVTQEQGVYQGGDWVSLVGKEPFWRTTHLLERDTDKTKTFPLKKFGKGHLFGILLYDSLMGIKFPECKEGSVPEEGFLFENREAPLDRLVERIEQLQKQGITPENKGQFYDTKKAYFHVIKAEQTYPERMQRLLDHATMKIEIRNVAEEEGTDIFTIYRRMLQKIGIDEKEVEGRRFWNPFSEVSMWKAFPKEVMETVLSRFAERGLLH
jgi:hypothetical protein